MTRNRIKLIISGIAIAAIIAGLIVGNVICGINFKLITQFICGFGIDYDSEEAQAARSQGNALAVRIEEEGIVLLKNENNALPLKNSKVNVFGWGGSNAGFVYQGGGSGEGSSYGRVSLLAGLKSAKPKTTDDPEEPEVPRFEYNETLAKAYSDLGYGRETAPDNVGLFDEYFKIIEAEADFYTDTLMSQAKSYSDTALVVLTRRSAEGYDLPKYQMNRRGVKTTERIYAAISELEELMLQKVTEAFENVVIILNNSNPMELGFIEDDKIDAVLTMGMPGNQGTIGLAKVLSGEVNPSGKLADIYAYDMSTAATYVHAGRDGTLSYTDYGSPSLELSARGNKYTDYAEDIYIGYKWYETADAEGYWSGVSNQYGSGYEGIVQFPFGYGESYTEFSWTVDNVGLVDGAQLFKNGKISFDVFVENTGAVAGADVVQLYYTPPYTKGGIEKSAAVLGAFAKTGVLKPGAGEKLTLEMNAEDMKSYDAYDRNNNGFMGYELEAGDYIVSLRTDSHTPAKVANADGKNAFTYKVPAPGYKYEMDTISNGEVKNRFTTYKNTVSGVESKIDELLTPKAHSVDGAEEPTKINYITRADFKNSFPSQIEAPREMGDLLGDTFFSTTPYINENDIMPKYASTESTYTIEDMFGLKYSDKRWDDLVSQLTIKQMAEFCARGGMGTMAISTIGKPKTVDLDGPSGFNTVVTGSDGGRAVNYPCETVLAQTWDWKLAYQYGVSVGKEGQALGISGWYAPGANMHRSPLGGRNFEYYSEDPYLSGIMCAYTVYGAKEQGVYSYIKHFAVNDSDTGRDGSYRWLTEQNLRETYLKPFEIAIKIGGANAIMTSLDRIGSVRASGSHALLTNVLRDEWGFQGSVITDYFHPTDKHVHDVDECIRAGNDLVLHPDGNTNWYDDLTSATTVIALQKSTKNILYTYVDTLHTYETASELDIGSTIGTKGDVFPWWIFLLIGIDVIVGGACVVWGIMAVKYYIKKSRKLAQGTAAA